MSFSRFEFDQFVQNLNRASFQLSKQVEIEYEESCDCDKCVEKRKGQ